MGFNLGLHLRRHDAFPTPEKRRYAGKINLSSNELTHAGLAALFSGFVGGFDPVHAPREGAEVGGVGSAEEARGVAENPPATSTTPTGRA